MDRRFIHHRSRAFRTLLQGRKVLCAVASIVALLSETACGAGAGSSIESSPVANASPPPSLPIPNTPAVIIGVTFDQASHRRAAEGSDNWPATWSDDDHQYAVWGDGGGFGGDEQTGRVSFGVARIEGDRDNYRGVNRFGGINGECPSTIDGKGHGAPLSVGGVLYAWITPGSGVSGYDSFTLYKSLDKGCSWAPLDVAFVRSTEGISYGSFVQFGRDNVLAADAFVYTVATVVTNTQALNIVQSPGRIMLVRVPIAAIEDRGAYEYYAGPDATGEPTWSTDLAKRVPIYEDPDGVGAFAQMSYVPGLDRLVYTNQHGDGVSFMGSQSLLTVAEAPHPWGPWSVIYRDPFFPEIEHSVFQWNFAPKWFSPDGRQFTLIFSGEGTNDSWNTINGVFSTQ